MNGANTHQRKLLAEIGVVLLIGVVPFLWRSIADLIWPTEAMQTIVWFRAWGSLTEAVCIAGPVLYLIHRTGRPWVTFGVVAPVWTLDLLLSIVLTVSMTLSANFAVLLQTLLWRVFPSVYSALGFIEPTLADPTVHAADRNASGFAAHVVSMLCGAFIEEVVIRSYLTVRLLDLVGSWWKASAIAAGLMASYHVYQGSTAVLVIFLEQWVVCMAFLWLRRLWPFVLAHAAYNVLISLRYWY